MKTEPNILRQKLTKKEGWISILFNTFLFAIKYFAGVSSGSLALIADAWHTLSDSLSSVFVLISARYSFKKPDKEHPFGHGRFELITSIFIGILLILIAFNFIKEGIVKFYNHEEAQFGWLAITATVLSIVMKEGLAQYAFWAYRKTKSETLKADGWHHRSDAISSVVILVGILVGSYLWWIDAALSIVVAFFLLYAAYEIIRNSISGILGEEASSETILQIKTLANQVAGIEVHAHHVHLHNYVTHQEVTFHIRLNNHLNIYEAHEITSSIEKAIREQLNIEATIHIDPLIK
ncbi:MAG: cation transporter [Prolixibacteraceae bacterium]|nr:cation transporter [Prolixibacteraceae bacterium]